MVTVVAGADPGAAFGQAGRVAVTLRAEAEAAPPASAVAGGSMEPAQASGGGKRDIYSILETFEALAGLGSAS